MNLYIFFVCTSTMMLYQRTSLIISKICLPIYYNIVQNSHYLMILQNNILTIFYRNNLEIFIFLTITYIFNFIFKEEYS